jgi:ABC-type transport system substrate-binding protein
MSVTGESSMNTAVRRGAVIVVLVLSAACGSPGPASPTGSSQPPALRSPAPSPPTNFAPLSGPSRTFVFDRGLVYAVRGYTGTSRFVLYDNGAFVLQYVGLGAEYRGGYTQANGVITFQWEGWSTAGAWGATGTITGTSLTVQYNLIMQMTDFEDAVYVLKP